MTIIFVFVAVEMGIIGKQFLRQLILPYNFWRQFIRLLECYVSYSQESNEFVILIFLSL